MTKEEMNYYADKAIKDFPKWPNHAVCIWVGKRGNNNPSFYALDEVAVSAHGSGVDDFETEGNGVYNGKDFYYSAYHNHWFKVTPELYSQRKREVTMLGSNDWYERGELPPVETTHEDAELVGLGYSNPNYEIVAHHYNGVTAIVAVSVEGGLSLHNAKHAHFRPIQTERQRLVNLAITTAEESGEEFDQSFAEALYDAGLLRDNNKENNNE